MAESSTEKLKRIMAKYLDDTHPGGQGDWDKTGCGQKHELERCMKKMIAAGVSEDKAFECLKQACEQREDDGTEHFYELLSDCTGKIIKA